MKLFMVSILILILSANSYGGAVDLEPSFIFEVDQELVSQEIALIKQEFKKKFGLEVTVTPELIQVDNESDPFGEYSYHNISFGKLSLQQFNMLKKYYKFPITPTVSWVLNYDAKRNYRLIDFLVPKIQPLLAKTMFFGIPAKRLDSKMSEKEYVFFSSNCWSTVHEVLVSDRWPFDFHGYVTDSQENGLNVVREALGDATTSKEIIYDAQTIQAYDYFLHSADDALTHTALFVGPGLIFEKVGLGFDRFRVGYHTHNGDFHKYRRLYKSIKHPKDLSILQSETEDDKYWQFPLKIVPNTSGNYILDPNNITSKTVTDSLIRICTLEDAEKNLCTNFPWENGPAYKLSE